MLRPMSGVTSSDRLGTGLITWSAEALPESERVLAWTRLVSERFVPFQIEYDGPEPFWLHATLNTLGPITLGELRGCAHRLTRVTSPAHRTPAEAGRGQLVVSLQLAGRSTARGPGDALHVSARITGVMAVDWPGLIELPDNFHQLVLMLPADLLPISVTDGVKTGGRLAPAAAATDLLANTVDYLVRHADVLDPATARLACTQLLELLALAFADSGTGKRSADLLARIHDEIEGRLGDPALRTVHIARALNVSPRYVQQLLASEGTTFTRLVTQRRILRCRVAFDTDPEQARTNAQIALQHGFASVAHFSRIFSRHTGLSPRAYRAAVRIQSSPAVRR